MNGAFTGQILAEKLAKLNCSQQSIETLSHWCIFHRKKAKQVVQTWDRAFHVSEREQRVAYLYLANDILQNSRRKGGEFVTEFWKVLAGALRDVMENGDDSGRNTVYRLVDIWEERRVFGSRAQSLREELLGKGPVSPVQDGAERDKPSASPSKIQNVVVPSILEKVSAAYQAVQDGLADEEEALANCNAALSQVENLEKDVENRGNSGETQDRPLADELHEQQTVLAQCIERLETSEMTRAAVVQHLKEALQEQESKLEHIRTQLQIAQAQSEQAGSVRQRLLTGSPSFSNLSPISRDNGAPISKDAALNPQSDTVLDKDVSTTRAGIASGTPPLTAPVVLERTAPLDEESKKPKNGNAAAAAADIAAKLAANSSSAAMLTSVLSSLAAEQATSLSTSGTPGNISLDVPSLVRPLEKRQRIDGRPDGSDGLSPYMNPQLSPIQPTHQPPLPQPLPMGQYIGGAPMMSVQYGYGNALPPPPMQGHPMMGMPRMGGPPQPLPPGYGPPYQPMQPPSMGYYSQPPLPAPPAPIPRQ